MHNLEQGNISLDSMLSIHTGQMLIYGKSEVVYYKDTQYLQTEDTHRVVGEGGGEA